MSGQQMAANDPTAKLADVLAQSPLAKLQAAGFGVISGGGGSVVVTFKGTPVGTASSPAQINALAAKLLGGP